MFSQRFSPFPLASLFVSTGAFQELGVLRIGSSFDPFGVLWDEDCFYKRIQLLEQDVGEERTDHPSYNVAKKVLEFEYQEEILRSRLRAAYGDGFQGAPLRCQSSGEGLFTQDAATCDGTATQAPSSLSQENNHIGGSCHV